MTFFSLLNSFGNMKEVELKGGSSICTTSEFSKSAGSVLDLSNRQIHQNIPLARDLNVLFSLNESHNKYNVSFKEINLPSGTKWAVNLKGKTKTSSTGTIIFFLFNGTYEYKVGNVGGYKAFHSSGIINVEGHSVKKDIIFTNTSSNYYSGFSTVETSIDYKNYTLPDYNYSQYDGDIDRGKGLVGNPPIFTRNNIFHQAGFVYLDTFSNLVFYSLETKSLKILHSNWINLSQSGRVFYGERNWLEYYQLPNGSLFDVFTYGQYHNRGNAYVEIYYFYNNTYGMSYQSMPFDCGIHFSVYQITNDSFWSSKTHLSYSGLGLDYVNTLQWNKGIINSKRTKNWTYEGLAVDDSHANSAFAEVSGNNNGSMMIQLWRNSPFMKQDFNIIDTKTERVKWVNTTFNIPQQWLGLNNVPFTFVKLSKNVVLYYNYVQINSVFDHYNYALLKVYFDDKSESILKTSYKVFPDTLTVANELLTNEPYISYSGFYNGMQINTKFNGQEFYNYLTSTRWISSNSPYLNSLMQWNKGPRYKALQLADASVNDYESYVYSGARSVSGNNNHIAVFWLPKYTKEFYTYNSSSKVTKYRVNFSETGLPSGSAWYVSITGLNGLIYKSNALKTSSHSLNLTNGSYEYSIWAKNSIYTSRGGSFLLIGTIFKNNINVSFYKVKYTVKFNETGLPPGLNWTLVFDEQKLELTNNSYIFHIINGTYTYEATSPDYFIVYGSVLVNGSDKQINLSFILQTFTVTFREYNLPNGTVWYVNITGHDSGPITNSTYNLSLTDGTYSYAIITPDHLFQSILSSGSFNVSGTNVLESVFFYKVEHSGSDPYLYISLAVEIVIAVSLVIYIRKKK